MYRGAAVNSKSKPVAKETARPVMRLAGQVKGAQDLSMRKGYSKK